MELSQPMIIEFILKTYKSILWHAFQIQVFNTLYKHLVLLIVFHFVSEMCVCYLAAKEIILQWMDFLRKFTFVSGHLSPSSITWLVPPTFVFMRVMSFILVIRLNCLLILILFHHLPKPTLSLVFPLIFQPVDINSKQLTHLWY